MRPEHRLGHPFFSEDLLESKETRDGWLAKAVPGHRTARS